MIIKCQPLISLKMRLFGLDPSYGGLTTIGPVIIRGDAEPEPWMLIHEGIHIRQWKELFGVGYVAMFWALWFRELFRHRSMQLAYLKHPMEREAIIHEVDPDYLKTRRRFAWAEYL